MSGVADSSGRTYHVQAKACRASSEGPLQGGQRRKRRTSLLLLGGCGRPHNPRTRRHTTSVEQVYRAVPWKAVQIGVRGPRGLCETVTGEGHLRIEQLVAPLVEAWKIFQPRIRLASTGAPLDATACTALLVGQEIILEDRRHYAPLTRWGFDSRFGILEELAISEKEYNADLTGVYNLYVKPLK